MPAASDSLSNTCLCISPTHILRRNGQITFISANAILQVFCCTTFCEDSTIMEVLTTIYAFDLLGQASYRHLREPATDGHVTAGWSFVQKTTKTSHFFIRKGKIMQKQHIKIKNVFTFRLKCGSIYVK